MKLRIYRIIEVAEQGDHLSRAYDWVMMVAIVASIIPMCFKVQSDLLVIVDRITVGLFIVDYILRWVTANFKYPEKGLKAYLVYPFTAWAIVDLLAILPSLSRLNSAFRVLKVLRLFRSMRVFKALRYSKSFSLIVNVFRREKSALLSVLCFALGYIAITALIMFNAEPNSFDSFFDALYWATTALTTVGYGDIYPVTVVGRIISMVSSLAGIAVVALPAGIITGGYLEEIETNKNKK